MDDYKDFDKNRDGDDDDSFNGHWRDDGNL